MSVIAIDGYKKASNTIYPVSEAYNVMFGRKRLKHCNNIINCLYVLYIRRRMNAGVSRLFQKLSVKGIAPEYLSKLVS